MVAQDLSAPRPGRPSAERKLAQWPRRVASECVGHAAMWAVMPAFMLFPLVLVRAAPSYPDALPFDGFLSPLWHPILVGAALPVAALLCSLGFRQRWEFARLGYVAVVSVGAPVWAALILFCLARWVVVEVWPHRGAGTALVTAEALALSAVALISYTALRDARPLARVVRSPLARAVCVRGEELRTAVGETDDWLREVWGHGAPVSGDCLLAAKGVRYARLRAVLCYVPYLVWVTAFAVCMGGFFRRAPFLLTGWVIHPLIYVPSTILSQRRSIAAISWDDAGLRLTPRLGRTVAIPWTDVQQLQVYVPPAQTALMAAGGPAHLFIATRYSPCLLPMTWQEECLQLLRALNARTTVFDTNPTGDRLIVHRGRLVEKAWVEDVEP